MPIRPENIARYPKDWKEIRRRVLARAGQRVDDAGSVTREAACEWCGVENHAIGQRDARGEFRPMTMAEADVAGMDGENVLQIVLTIAHVVDPAPENCAGWNLAALCQACHLNHDRAHHNRMRVQNEIEAGMKAGQMMLTPQTPADGSK